MEMHEVFFDLLRLSLGQDIKIDQGLAPEDWKALYELAEKHAVLGVCLAGLEAMDKQGLRPPQSLLLQWIGMSQQIEAKNKVVNEQCIALQDRLNNDGFRTCILKGQGNARMYGLLNPQLDLWRQSGDIDVWVEGGFEKIMRYMQHVSPTDEVNEQHVHFHVFEDTEVEVHFTPSRMANRVVDRRLQKWFVKEQERQMNHQVGFYGRKINVPTDDFNLVYQMIHIYRHLFNEGIGLRQLMDYYVLLKEAQLKADEKQYVIWEVKRFGMERFAKALMWMMGYVFHLPEDEMLWEQDEERGCFLLKEVIQMGNFGHSDDRYRLNVKDSHIKRYLQAIRSKTRFVKYYPTEALWQPVDMFLRFFELRMIRRKVKQIV